MRNGSGMGGKRRQMAGPDTGGGGARTTTEAARGRKGFRLTGRDRAIVAFAGRQRAVEARQVAERFQMDLANTYRRSARLVAEGLLEHRRVLHGAPGVYMATRAGLDWASLRLPVARIDLATYAHDVEAVWLAIELEREFTADRVLTERELRSREMSAAWAAHRGGAPVEPRYAVPLNPNGGPRGLHFPDLVVEGGGPRGGLLAIELERTAKGASRLRRIIAAYRDGLHVEQVRYYASDGTLPALERSIAEERGNHVAQVFDLRPWRPRSAVPALVPWLLAAGSQSADEPSRRIEPVPLQDLGERLAPVAASFAGALAVTVVAIYLACRWSRLRWTWAIALGAMLTAVSAALAPVPLAGALGAAVGGAVVACTLWDEERKDERRGGRRRRRARSKRGPVEMWIAARSRRRVRRGPLGAIDLDGARLWPRWWRRGPARIALGEDLVQRRPVWLAFDQLAKHLLILGATGGGKSNSLLWIVTRAIRAGYGSLVLDMKGDPALRERLMVEAGLCRRPFYLWRIEGGGQLYNPLAAGDSTARRDRLTASQTFSEDYYRGLFSAHAKVVLDALASSGRDVTLDAVAAFWDPGDLKGLVRAVDDRTVAEAIARYCERLPRGQLEHIASLRTRISEVTDTTAGEWLRAGRSAAEEIDLRDVLRRRAVVVFSVNSDSYPGAAATIGNLVLQDLVGAVGEFRQERISVRSVVAVDEFGALSGEQLGRLLSTARDVGLPMVLAGQDLAQLRRVSEHFEAEVKANVSALIAHRQSEPDSAEQIARICGTEEVIQQTQQINRLRSPLLFGEPDHATGVGSEHYERDFRVPPDAIKELSNGEAVVRAWNPADVHVVRMYRCETAQEAAALGTVSGEDGRRRRATVAEVARAAERLRLASVVSESAP